MGRPICRDLFQHCYCSYYHCYYSSHPWQFNSAGTIALTRLLSSKRLLAGHQTTYGDISSIAICTSTNMHVENGNEKPWCNIEDVQILCKKGQLKEAVQLLEVANQGAKKAYLDTYICLLQSCTNTKTLINGKQVHAHIIKNGFRPNIYLGNNLIAMYAKCGSMLDARQVFDSLLEKNVFTWTFMIDGYSKNGLPREALKLFWHMEQEDIKPDKVTFVCVLQICASLGSLEEGKQVHDYIIRSGCHPDIFLGSTIANMYAKCGSIKHARQLFDKMPKRDVVSWNTMFSGYAKHEQVQDALDLFRKMMQDGMVPDKVTFLSILNVCSIGELLEYGKQVHAHIIRSEFESDVSVGNSLVNMYVKCGTLKHAHQVFDRMPKRDVISWNVMIAGYAKFGHLERALDFFWLMQSEAMRPDEATFLSILKGCAALGALEEGKQIHTYIVRTGFNAGSFVRSALIDMYAKCGSLEDARQIFDHSSKQNLPLWNAMIGAYVQQVQAEEALSLFWRMELEGVKPDAITFASILKACSSIRSLEQGKSIHNCVLKSGLEQDAFVGSALIDMYAKCWSIELAWKVFGKMHRPDVAAWNAMIGGCARDGDGKQALKLFWQMQQVGLKPDDITFIIVIDVCSILKALEMGKHIHALVIESDRGSSMFVGSSLIDMYSKCGSINHARQIFDGMIYRDVVLWNAMISGYVQNGCAEEAVKLFQQMEREGVRPNESTFISVLKACANMENLVQGTKIHGYITASELASSVSLGSSLIGMYAKCGTIEFAHCVFDKMPQRDLVSWTAMIAGFNQHGHAEEALNLFWQMQSEGLKPAEITFTSILKACASLKSLEHGEQIHALIIANEMDSDNFVGSSLVDMYSKCGNIKHARFVFNKMPKRDVVSWTAMISGYAENGYPKEALELFQQMKLLKGEGIEPDKITFISILKSCANLAVLDHGMDMHAEVNKTIFKFDIDVANTLVFMYAKCGSIEHARQVFEEIPNRDAVSWNVMIAGYAQMGDSKLALQLVGKMLQEGVQLDHISFLAILFACSHAGLVDEGHCFFHSMSLGHGITPTAEHYACMIDLFGRAGCLEEAYEFIKRIHIQPSATIWRCLLGACRIHGKLEVVNYTADYILELEPENSANFVLLSNIFGSAYMWNERTKLMK